MRTARPPAWALAVLVVATLLLLSMGGAVVAAPVTVPTLLWAARHHLQGALRAVAAVLAGATAGELVYVAAGEPQPAIWLVPVAAAGGSAVAGLWPRPARSIEVSASAGWGRANR